MTKIEKKFFDFIQKNVLIIGYLAVTAVGILIRYCGWEYESGDFLSFLNPWWVKIRIGGIEGLATQVGNYNIPYQILTFIFTLLPFGALSSYKIISVVFDFVLAISAALLANAYNNRKSELKPFLVYSIVLCSVTVVFNSSFWAQCDSIYVSFILLALYFTKKDRNILAFVMLGLSFTFKLQMVFILPLFLIYYISERKISILHFLIIPLVDIIMCLPALIFGRKFTDIFTIYFAQTDYGKQIQMNFPNFWAFLCNGKEVENYYLLKSFSIFLTFLILGVALALIIYKKAKLDSSEKFLLTAIWTVFTCLMFLSSMHERYGYLLDILTLIYAAVTMKHLWLPIVCQLVSLRGYCYYLFNNFEALDLKTTSIIYIAVYAYVTYLFLKEVLINRTDCDVTPLTNGVDSLQNEQTFTPENVVCENSYDDDEVAQPANSEFYFENEEITTSELSL